MPPCFMSVIDENIYHVQVASSSYSPVWYNYIDTSIDLSVSKYSPQLTDTVDTCSHWSVQKRHKWTKCQFSLRTLLISLIIEGRIDLFIQSHLYCFSTGVFNRLILPLPVSWPIKGKCWWHQRAVSGTCQSLICRAHHSWRRFGVWWLTVCILSGSLVMMMMMMMPEKWQTFNL